MTADHDAHGASIHASAVRVGDHAVLIRGPSGAGKSRLAFDLILAGRVGYIPPTVLVGDDRVYVEARGEKSVVSLVPQLAGLIEIRGLGIRQCDFTQEAPIGLVVDLSADDAERLPAPEKRWIRISGIKIPRIAVGIGHAALPLVVAALTTTEGSLSGFAFEDCLKGIGNHIRLSIASE